jgi:hypothetical protein
MNTSHHEHAKTDQRDANFRVYNPRVFSRRTKQRFISDRTAELIRHLARAPSYPERLIIARIISLEWELRRLDARIDDGEVLSGHALRARLAAENRLRLDLAALGLKPAAPRVPTLAEHIAAIAEREAREAAA